MDNTPLRIFIGFDPRQVISYTTAATSIVANSTAPVSITPLDIRQLPIQRTGLTPFTYTRFLVPWLCNFEGRALFIDADIAVSGDIKQLFVDTAKAITNNDSIAPALWVRDMPPEYHFERAAVMLFENEHEDNKVLTPEFINDAAQCKTPHLIDWTSEVCAFADEWHHLVGYDEPDVKAKLIHYTQGVPAWPETVRCEHSDLWNFYTQCAFWPWSVRDAEVKVPWDALMGNSVHTKTLDSGRKVPKLFDPALEEATFGGDAVSAEPEPESA